VEFGILVFDLLVDVVVFRWANRVSEKLDENRMLVTEKVFWLPDCCDRGAAGPGRPSPDWGPRVCSAL